MRDRALPVGDIAMNAHNYTDDALENDYKIIIWKAQGVAHPKHPEEEETSPNRNHIITGKQ